VKREGHQSIGEKKKAIVGRKNESPIISLDELLNIDGILRGKA